MYGSDMHGWMFDGWGGMLFGGVWLILAWLIPFLIAVALLKYLFGKRRSDENQPAQRTALDILKEAYARNEIDRDTYLQKRDDLLEKH